MDAADEEEEEEEEARESFGMRREDDWRAPGKSKRRRHSGVTSPMEKEFAGLVGCNFVCPGVGQQSGPPRNAC